MLDWPIALAAGGGGGVIVEVVVFLQNIDSWRDARRRARISAGSALPPISDHIDTVPDGLAAVTRMVIGAALGVVFHTQITGLWAAVAIGASGPALVRRMGSMRSVQEAIGDDGTPPGAGS